MSFLDFFFFFGFFCFKSQTYPTSLGGWGGSRGRGGGSANSFPFSCGHTGPGLKWEIHQHQRLLLTGDRDVISEP